MITYINRKTQKQEVEKVAGDKYLSWTYSSPAGMKLLEFFVKKKLFSLLIGAWYSSPLSKRKIKGFVKDFNIDMSMCKNTSGNFKCFNDFFIRELNGEARPIDMHKENLISPGDGKLLAYENIVPQKLIQVKGFTYSLSELIGSETLAEKYTGGTCLILRLCPTDYHRFHFIDSGSCSESNKIRGNYYSVNPIALEKVPQLFCRNKREWSTLNSDNFGDVLYVEVGATCVGTIIQSYTPNTPVKKGDEKGYFKFGGSTTILFFEKDKIKIDEDILKNTTSGFETAVIMGEKIGKSLL